MQTRFSAAQLADSATAESASIIRTCVHCGFCTATCPTYVTLGDELDSPRGRIVLIKDMLESDRPASPTVVKHVDRCLSCLSCMTTCPSGVNYMHLVDHARARIEETYTRPLPERMLRDMLALVLPRPALFRWALRLAAWARPLAVLMPGRLRTMVRLAPRRLPPASAADRPGTTPAQGARRRRVALMTGCAQQVLAPSINEATLRLLARAGCEVVVAQGSGCCGALVHHLGRDDDMRNYARRNVQAWDREIAAGGLDAILINASGCGTMVKDYAFLLREDSAVAEAAQRVSQRTRDICEFLAELGLDGLAMNAPALRVAYQSPCSLAHGQRVHEPPRALLRAVGFQVSDIPEDHLCCGSAGTYNIMQPGMAATLAQRKAERIRSVGPDVVASGNIGCMTQLGTVLDVPIVHSVELLDWATGGPMPPAVSACSRVVAAAEANNN